MLLRLCGHCYDMVSSPGLQEAELLLQSQEPCAVSWLSHCWELCASWGAWVTLVLCSSWGCKKRQGMRWCTSGSSDFHWPVNKDSFSGSINVSLSFSFQKNIFCLLAEQVGCFHTLMSLLLVLKIMQRSDVCSGKDKIWVVNLIGKDEMYRKQQSTGGIFVHHVLLWWFKEL